MLKFITKTYNGYLGEIYAENWEQAREYCPPNAEVVGQVILELDTDIDIGFCN